MIRGMLPEYDKSPKKDKALDNAFMDTNCSMLAFSKMSAL